MKVTINEKIETIDNKIKQNKAEYNLDRQSAEISPLSSGNVSKYQFLTGKDVLPEKELLEEAGTMKRFEYSLLHKELKAQTDITKRQYQKLYNTYEPEKIITKENPTLSKYNRPNLIYDCKYSFYPYYNIKNFNSIFLTSKYPFYWELIKFNSLNPQKERTKEEKKDTMYNNASGLHNEYQERYFN